MTLQQKYAIKKSKKGFTLVELVVVIAILAILAAIAIPSVISIINSASQSQEDTTASQMNNACKEYYAGVIGGRINSTDKGNSTQPDLPAKNSSISSKYKAATSATVQYALEYADLYPSLKNVLKAGDNTFVYDSKGNIYSATNPEYSSLTDYVQASTTLGTLYH